MRKFGNLEKNILDTALQLAEDRSWETLHLHDIASELDISLTEIQQYYRQKDDLVEAWYDCADTSMLKAAETEEFSSLDKDTRLHRLIMTWLDNLAIHKTVSRDMLLYKLEPAHVHLQVLGILRVSRTVQWFLEAAQSKTTHLQRIFEEIHLTSIYLMAFCYWMQDKSDNQQASRDFLWRRLK
jgi:AcrR family transcriptional regulator